jgi:hypothetical protein
LQIDQANKMIVQISMRIKGLLGLLIFISSCEYFKPQDKIAQEPVARAGESYLYQEDLMGLTPQKLSSEDSTKLVNKYVDDWIKKQLIVDKAMSEIAINEAEIERKLLDYRYALISHEFEKLYINSHLNTEVTQEEIEQYYTERSDNFILKQNIIKCLFIQVPKSVPALTQLRRNLRSYPNTNKNDIKEFAYKYAVKSFLDDSLWVNFDELMVSTPLKDIESRIQFLQRTTFSETSDDSYVYYLKILDYKISDQVSPLEFISEDIENIIINKRKLALKKELEKAIYDEAVTKNSFEIFID